MFIIYFLILVIFMISIITYIYFYLSRMVQFWNLDIKRKIVKLIVGIFTATLGIILINVMGTGSIIILHVVFMSFILEILNLVYKMISKRKNAKSVKWEKLYKSGLIPILASIIILGYGYYNIGHVVEKDYNIKTEKRIRQEGYRIAMISDLHFGTTVDKIKLQKYCELVEKSKPDMVVLCGDIVDENTTLSEMKEAIQELGSIKSTYGTFYVYGNHDKMKYTSKPDFTKEDLQTELSINKINVLVDGTYNLNDEFEIIGRDDLSHPEDSERLSSEELLENVSQDKFTLLLDHQPSDLNENSKLGYDLQLSGHTHAGQIWPVGLICDLFNINDLNYGYEKIDNFQVIVSSGISGWGYPIRTGSNSEYVIIDVNEI